MDPQEQVLKTIETSDFATGGLLNPKRQNQFIKMVRDFGKMLPMVRFERFSQTQSTLDKLYIGEPITHAVEENDPTAYLAKPVTGQMHFQTKKLKSSWNITTETLVDNIEQKGFEQTMMDGMTQRISNDIELLAIQGDEEKYAGDVDTFGRLLKRQDGWDKLTQQAHVLDVQGSPIEKGIFAEMIRMMPQQYLNDTGLRWFVSQSVAIDWMDLLTDRGTALGDAALNGNSVSPYGFKMEIIPYIPTDKELPTSNGTPAAVMGTEASPFVIKKGQNDKLKIAVDGATAQEITLPEGTLTGTIVAAAINDKFPGLARVDEVTGRMRLISPTEGSSSNITISSVTNNAYFELGLSEGSNTGTNQGTGGTVKDGSFIWLANPKNFIAIMRGNTRVYTEFNKDYDRLENVVYNEVDFGIENEDAIVKAVNLRKRKLI